MDGSEVGPADGLDHFTVEVSVLQRHYGLRHRVVQEVGRSDKLEEYEMLDRNDQGREEIQHDAEPPCMEETDASAYVLPVTLANELYKRMMDKKEYGLKIEHRDIGKDALRGK